MPGRRMRRVCAGTLVHYEQTVRRRVTMPGRRMRRVCAGTLVHYEQTVRLSSAGPWRQARCALSWHWPSAWQDHLRPTTQRSGGAG